MSGAAELRVKESDRIAALAEGLTRLGATVEERPDGLAIDGGTPLHGAAVRAHDDHRIAMALAVAGLGRRRHHVDRGRRVRFGLLPRVLRRAGRRGQPWVSGLPSASCSSASWARARARSGAVLARRLGWGFVDMDERIEERTGLTDRRHLPGAKAKPPFARRSWRWPGSSIGAPGA